MKVSKLLVAAAVASVSAAGVAGAQTTAYTSADNTPQNKGCDGTATSCTLSTLTTTLGTFAKVNDILRLKVDRTVVDLGSPVESDFDAGNKDAALPTRVEIKSNRPYTVSIAAANGTFLYTGALASATGRTDKAAGDLKWGTATGARTNVLNTTGASLLTTVSGTTGTASSTADVFFNTLWSYAKDVPGNYSLDVKFTVSAP